MRSWHLQRHSGPDGLMLSDETVVPPPGPDDVVIATGAVALNARDHYIAAGRYHKRAPDGAVPCSDAAGIVTAIGERVAALRVGDRVATCFVPGWIDGPLTRAALSGTPGAGTVPGVLAERLVLPESAVVPLPPHLTLIEGATLPCAALVAWHALFESDAAPPRESVLTLGTGGVSMFAIRFARAAGLRVMATSGDERKRQRLADEEGVTQTIDYRRQALWGEAARRMAGSDGVDQIIEVGGQGTLEQSLRAIRPGGTISLIGTLAASTPVSLLPLLLQGARLQGIVAGSRAMFLRMNAAIERWQLRPPVDRVFAFADAPAAFHHLASGAHMGKVVIQVGSEA